MVPTIGDDNIDWDKDAERAAKVNWPYTSRGSLMYLDDVLPQRFMVLDLGCQIGSWYTAWKELRPKCQYQGLDFSQFAIDIAKGRYPHSAFYCMNAIEMTFYKSFDVIFTHTVFQHMNETTLKKVIPKIHVALVDNGLFIIEENITGEYSPEYWPTLIIPFGFHLVKSLDTKNGGMNYVFRKV